MKLLIEDKSKVHSNYAVCQRHFISECTNPRSPRLNVYSLPSMHLPGFSEQPTVKNSFAYPAYVLQGGNGSTVCLPSDDNCIEEPSLRSQVVEDTVHENHSEGVITFCVTDARQQLGDPNTRVFSHIQYINSLPWKVMLQRRVSYLGVFLCLHGSEYEPSSKVYAEFGFRLVDQTDASNFVVEVGHHKFSRGGTGHGFPNFADVDKLLNPEGNFLRNNTIVIECHVACSSLLKVTDISASADDAIQTFVQKNDLSLDYLADRAKYVLENGVGSDCKFIVDGYTKKVSKAILARASPVFERMFFVDGKGHDFYLVKDISGSVFDLVLQHIYGVSWVFESKVQATELYYAALKYELKDLQVICIQYIWPTTLDDVWVSLDCAVRYKLEDLQEAALVILRKNAVKAFESLPFLSISLDCLTLILKQTHLKVTSEMDVFSAALRWASAACKTKNVAVTGKNLRSTLGEAIRHIRFLSMTNKEFAGSPCESGVLTEQEKADVFQRLTAEKYEPLLLELSGIKSLRHK
ncbi:uncharacterized protein LOC134532721 isoform X2 [Bacillus rossius redtenbacheri]